VRHGYDWGQRYNGNSVLGANQSWTEAFRKKRALGRKRVGSPVGGVVLFASFRRIVAIR